MSGEPLSPSSLRSALAVLRRMEAGVHQGWEHLHPPPHQPGHFRRCRDRVRVRTWQRGPDRARGVHRADQHCSRGRRPPGEEVIVAEVGMHHVHAPLAQPAHVSPDDPGGRLHRELQPPVSSRPRASNLGTAGSSDSTFPRRRPPPPSPRAPPPAARARAAPRSPRARSRWDSPAGAGSSSAWPSPLASLRLSCPGRAARQARVPSVASPCGRHGSTRPDPSSIQE